MSQAHVNGVLIVLHLRSSGMLMKIFPSTNSRSIFKLYAFGDTLDELIEILKQYDADDIVSVHELKIPDIRSDIRRRNQIS
jgi:hypothetical protein